MRFRIALGALVVVVLSAVAATGMASAAAGNSLTCTGGTFTGDPSTSTFTPINSGNYSSITITGVCQVQAGAVINVSGNINVAPGGLLDAQSWSSTITVGHNITAGAGSFLGLGCQPEGAIGRFAGVPCIDDPNQTVITVNGNITATNADDVLIRGVTVNGNVSIDGGSSDIPWSIKGDAIGGNLTVDGVTAEFFGVQFNTIGNNATLTNITANDEHSPPPGVTVVSNIVGNNLNCSGNAPFVSDGFFNGVNHVGHKATGQCAAISVSS
jgi:hypothetical protein